MTRHVPTALMQALLVASVVLSSAGFALAAETPYTVSSWPESGFGNHRAVVHVAAGADAVLAHIQWRRRDRDPETRDIRVYDLTTNQRVMDVVRARITREAGDIVFRPETVPGDYAVYYLPYQAPQSNFDAPGDYYPPADTAAADWLQRNGLPPDGMMSDAWLNLPRAQVLRIEARSEFDRLDPMEIVATAEEVRDLLQRTADAEYLLFAEDRRYPIRMPDDLPLRWVQSGPSELLQAEAQPGELYCFQLGVWAARAALEDLRLDATDLRNAEGAVIAADKITCPNLAGTDWLGRPISKRVDVAEGRVQPLWIGVQVPPDAAGAYEGAFTVTPVGMAPQTVKLSLRVEGELLADGGVSDLWRMSRLKWLDSTLGLDDDVVPPFTPLQVRGDTVSCLLRDVRFGPLGLPESIVSNGREVLAAPMAFTVTGGRGELRLSTPRTETVKQAPGVVERVTVAEGPDADLTVRCRMEADGCLMYHVTLQPRRTLRLSDVELLIPQRADCAPYMMGMGKRGGCRPERWSWKWHHRRANNMVWLGDVDAGLQLQLRPQEDVWEPTHLSQAGFAPSWDNGGKGGCDIAQEGDCVRVRAYSGDRVLRRGRPLELKFRLLITPFKPIDPNHWNWRYGDVRADGTVLHVHHGTPENPYINYPFLTVPLLTETIRSVKSITTGKADFGELRYGAAGNFRPQRGAAHIWMTVNFDPAAGSAGQARYNRPMFAVEWPDAGWVGFYWNIDDRGMRAYVSTGPADARRYPALLSSHSPEWKQGERHVVTLSWGDEFAIYVDGEKKAAAPFRGTLDLPLDKTSLILQNGGFIYDAIKVTGEPYKGDRPLAATLDDHTLLLDTFDAWEGGAVTRPERSASGEGGSLTGTFAALEGDAGRELHLTFREVPVLPRGVNLYDNVGQMSNYAAELWIIRSLGDEIMRVADVNPTQVGGATFGKEGGGYAWLREHLVSDYVPGWRQPLPWLGETDAAIEMQGLSRWHNYYIEGLNWLMGNTGLDGLYLDGISYDREITKRVAKVMLRNDPRSRIQCHGGDCWSPSWDPDRLVSTANSYLEHFPYLSNLWFGELYDYNMPPDYWLVEMSGIPFGLTGEMLNYQNGGNPYRGMIFGMSGRQHPSAPGMWRFWDEFGIQDAEWLGYWDRRCPVRTDEPSVLATVYRKSGKSLLALAHWPAERERRAAVAQKTSGPPTIDGRLAPGEWDAAARLTGFTLYEADSQAPDQTEVFVTWDERRLYVGFECAQSAGRPRAEVTSRDGHLWEDDAIELFIQPDCRADDYYQFIGNSAGAIYDSRGTADVAWDGDWTYETSMAEGSWSGELSIPLASLGIVPGAGDTTIGLNVCRDQQVPAARTSCWSPVSGSFHNTALFGRLTLSTADPSTRETGEQAGPRTVPVRLGIDWKALGLDATKAILTAPQIAGFQPAARFSPGDAIPIEPGKGMLLVVEGQE